MQNILRKILVAFVVPRLISWARRRFAGGRGGHRAR